VRTPRSFTPEPGSPFGPTVEGTPLTTATVCTVARSTVVSPGSRNENELRTTSTSPTATVNVAVHNQFVYVSSGLSVAIRRTPTTSLRVSCPASL
jgi:hypothetical protein